MVLVPSWGQTPNRVLICGEAPGKEEASAYPPRPFIGAAGREQRWYCSLYRMNPELWRQTNVIPLYKPGNPDPTLALIEKYTPRLIREVFECNPEVIVAAGRFAARWFLGEDFEMQAGHGMPHRPGHYDMSRADRCPKGTIIIPIHHPAAGLHEEDLKPVIYADYGGVKKVLDALARRQKISIPRDTLEGKEIYEDVTGRQLEDLIKRDQNKIKSIGMDTEGYFDDQFSIQVCWKPGISYVLRVDQPSFARGIEALNRIKHQITWILHNASTPSGCCYDLTMAKLMGLDLSRCRIYDTMYAAYLLRTIAKGLKPISRRFLDIKMSDFRSLLDGISKDRQVEYLKGIAKLRLPKPQTQIVRDNNNIYRFYTPKIISAVAAGIVRDVLSGKVTKKGPVDPFERWKETDPQQRRMIESTYGKMPRVTLRAVPLADAVVYAARDSDATKRLKPVFCAIHENLDLTRTMRKGMKVLPFFWEMQQNGLPASRKKFADLYEKLDGDVEEVTREISEKYFFGKPINPNSSSQVSQLMSFRGLQPTKYTKPSKRFPNGQVSTSKKSIEHYRYTDPAIALVFTAREIAHIRDYFCVSALDIIPEGCDIWDIHAALRPADTETRRLAAANPNLLAIPVRTEIGRMVRACYVCRPGYVFVGVDLSQIEMRVLAHRSRSKFLIQKFRDNADIHTETAMLVFGVDDPSSMPKDVWEFDFRTPTKTTNFGIIYGQQDTGLHDQLRMKGLTKWTLEECIKLRKEILRVFDIEPFIYKKIQETRKYGYSRSMDGMYRYLPNIHSPNSSKAAEAGRHAVSQDVQGTAQDIIQNSMIHIREDVHRWKAKGIDISPVLQIHDELIFIVPRGMEKKWSRLVIDRMTDPVCCGVQMRVPIVAKAHTGATWAELK